MLLCPYAPISCMNPPLFECPNVLMYYADCGPYPEPEPPSDPIQVQPTPLERALCITRRHRATLIGFCITTGFGNRRPDGPIFIINSSLTKIAICLYAFKFN